MKVISGKHAGSSGAYNWILTKDCSNEKLIGNYAIVENIDGYAMVRVIGVTEVEDKAASIRAMTGVNVNKKVIAIVTKEMLDKLKEDSEPLK